MLNRNDYRTLALSALGGIIMAHFDDLFGRKRMFMLSILLMAQPTLMIGQIHPFIRGNIIWQDLAYRRPRSSSPK